MSANGELSLAGRQQHFGANAFKEVKQKAFWSLLFENLKDPTLILLMVAALVRFVVLPNLLYVHLLTPCSN